MNRKSKTRKTRRPSAEVKVTAARLFKKITPLRRRSRSHGEDFIKRRQPRPRLTPSTEYQAMHRLGMRDGYLNTPRRNIDYIAYRKGYEEGSKGRAILEYLKNKLGLKSYREIAIFAINDLYRQFIALDRAKKP